MRKLVNRGPSLKVYLPLSFMTIISTKKQISKVSEVLKDFGRTPSPQTKKVKWKASALF